MKLLLVQSPATWVFISTTALIFAKPVLLDILSPVVQTKTGALRGKLIELTPGRESVYQFSGIPFAEPPVGERRFKKPVPTKKWTEVFEATKNGFSVNMCMQKLGDFEGGSEDCLSLNIWVPKMALHAAVANGMTRPLPVYVYIHGGGFYSGCALGPPYDSSVMSSFENIIVITIQYRLGLLGFAYFGKNDDAPGNLGLWDQLEALKWISENIAAFGGDNRRVTLGGHSAGAASVTFHLISPYSRKYFHRAVVESGTALCPWALLSPEKAKALTNIVVNKSNCSRPSVADTLVCLRHLDAIVFPQHAVELTTQMAFGLRLSFGLVPVIDGDFIPKHPRAMLKAGDFYKVPLLVGTVNDEGGYVVDVCAAELSSRKSTVSDVNFTDYANLMSMGFNHKAVINVSSFNGILRRYWPANGGVDVFKAVVQANGDYTFICPTYDWIKAASVFQQDVQIFVYQFTRRLSVSPQLPWLGVSHFENLWLIFGDPFAPHAQYVGYDNADKYLSKTALQYWGNFIKYGNPNARVACQLQKWLPYVNPNCQNQTAVFDVHLQAKCGLAAEACTFWEGLYPTIFANTN